MSLDGTILQDLTRRYLEPHRVFHTLQHIAHMFMLGRKVGLSDEQVLAIWYHDAIFDVHAPDNEARSAALAVRQLGAAGHRADSIAIVERIVLDTALHEASIEASEIVMDLDLATLGGPWEEFAANTMRMRAEFGHLDEDSFQARQAKMFRRMLDRERIYHTPWGAPREERARANLARAIEGA